MNFLYSLSTSDRIHFPQLSFVVFIFFYGLITIDISAKDHLEKEIDTNILLHYGSNDNIRYTKFLTELASAQTCLALKSMVLACTISGTDVSCNTTNTGAADATVSGGMPPYDFQWSNGDTTEDIGSLTVGTYELSVTDINNTMTTCQVIIGGLSCMINPIRCGPNNQGGAISIVSGGASPYEYIWSTGETTPNIFGHIPGTYSLIVTDANDCETICDVLIEPCLLCDTICETSFAKLNGSANCFDLYGFDQWGWSNGPLPQGVYTFELYASALACDIGVGELVGAVSVEYAADEVLVIVNTYPNTFLLRTDLYIGCEPATVNNGIQTVDPGVYPYRHVLNYKMNDTFLIDVNQLNCEGIFVSLHAGTCETNLLSCHIIEENQPCHVSYTSAAVANIIGGNAPYAYQWTTGEVTARIEGLIAGSYGLIVTDANDCEQYCEVIVDRCISCDTTCVTAFGQLNGFQQCFDNFGFTSWGWTNGLLSQGNYMFDLYAEALFCDTSSAEKIGEVVLNFQNDSVIAKYTLFGDYFLTLSSLYIGCEPIPENNGIQTTSPSQYTYIQGLNNVKNYTYRLDISSLPCEGIYVIAHAEACKRNPLICNINAVNSNCEGVVNVAVNGGTSPYKYEWSTGDTIRDLTNLPVGYYILSVTDASNCIVTCDVELTYNDIGVTQIGPFCQNDAPFNLSDLITDPNLMGSWSGQGVNAEIFYPSALMVGLYDIEYIDMSSCARAGMTIRVDTFCCPQDYAEVNGRKLIGIQTNEIRYETDGILDSEQKIQSNTVYDSQSQICLQVGFEVDLGAVFSAVIDGCP